MSADFKVDPLAYIHGGLVIAERHLLAAEPAAMRALQLVDVSVIDAGQSYALGLALGMVKVSVDHALTELRQLQDLIRPTLGEPT